MNTENRPPRTEITSATNGKTDNSLMHLSGVSERTITQGIAGIHDRIGTQVQSLQDRQRGFWSRLFIERGLTHVLEETKIQGVRDYSDYQRRLFRLATDTKLDMAHSVCLAMSRELKVGNQERFTAMVLDKHENLRRTVQSKREGFLADMDSALSNAEGYTHRPWLMEVAITSLQHETEEFFKWIDRELDDFMAISKQRLDEYRKAESAPARQALGSGGSWDA